MREQNYRIETFIRRIRHILPDAVYFQIGEDVIQILTDKSFIRNGKMLGLPYAVGGVAKKHVKVRSKDV